MRVGPPWIGPLLVTQSAQSMPSVRPLIQMPPSETGFSSVWKSLEYVFTEVCGGRSGIGLLSWFVVAVVRRRRAGRRPPTALP